MYTTQSHGAERNQRMNLSVDLAADVMLVQTRVAGR
jgi:hypothetical protein